MLYTLNVFIYFLFFFWYFKAKDLTCDIPHFYFSVEEEEKITYLTYKS